MIISKFNKNTAIFILLSLLLFFAFIYAINQEKKQDNIFDKQAAGFQNNCIAKTEERLVRGNSLSGLVEPGQTVKILFGFYDCNEIKRGDIAAYNYAGNPEPIIKIIKGISGDKFNLKSAESGGWNVIINDEIVKNSQNQPYVLKEKGYKMLSLYEKDYKGVIPENAYLILGNAANGTLDSSVFGFIDKSDILGKVE